MIKFGLGSVRRFKNPVYVNMRCFSETIRKWRDWQYDIPELRDSLYRDSKLDHHHGGMEEVINLIKNDPSMQLSGRNLGYLLYNLAKENLDHETLRSVVTNQFIKLAGRIEPRNAFGGYYGALVLNYPSIVCSFLQEEFLSHEKVYIKPDEICEIMEALSVNTSMDRHSHHVFIAGHLEPHINLKWRKQFYYYEKRLLTLIKSLDRLEYYHTDLFYKCIEHYCKLNCTVLDKFHDGLSCLHDILQRDVCTTDITKDIELYVNKSKKNKYFVKTYNYEAVRYYTYEELKEMRNDNFGLHMKFTSVEFGQNSDTLNHLAEKYRTEYTAEGIEAAKLKLTYDDQDDVADEDILKAVDEGDVLFDEEEIDEDLEQYEKELAEDSNSSNTEHDENQD